MSRMSPRAEVGAKAIRFAITGALAVGLLAGCAGSKQMARAGEHAARAQTNADRFIETAERNVQKSPSDAAARVTLGQAYLAAGRFQSAATSFADALALGDDSGSTQLRLALARIGTGDLRSAIAVLDEARDTIPASDRGLALALAGETSRGVAILLDELRAGENTTTLRQNLAYAYALDGRWREARITMAQDVPADQMDDRIGKWAMMSRPEDLQRRVANLLGVPFGVADAGQPAALALGTSARGEQLASAETPDSPAATELPPIDEPATAVRTASAPAEPAPAPPASAFSEAVTAPQAAFASKPVVQPLPARIGRVASSTGQPSVSPPAFKPAEGPGTHLVQLGSFSSEANARRAWGIFTTRNPELRNFRMTITQAVVRGKTYWRVAAGGLDGSTAVQLCSGLKNRGRNCFAYAANNAPAGSRPALAAGGAGMKARRH